MIRTLSALLLAALMILLCLMSYGFLMNNQFRYLYKIWQINPASVDRKYQDIAYAAGNGAHFVLYKDDLAVVGEGKLAVYDLTGEPRFRAEAPNSAQAFAVSDKYIALYTPGDKRFSIYNSFECVNEHTFPYPIRLATVSDSGKFALCLKEEERVVVEVYNSDLKKQLTVPFSENTVIYDIDLSVNGDKLAITTIVGGEIQGQGIYDTEFSLWDVSSEKQIFCEKVSGKKPIAASFFDNGRLFFAAEGTVIFCQSNGKNVKTVQAPSKYKIVSDGKTVALSDGEKLVTVYSARGDQKTEFPLSEKMIDLKIKDGYCYVFSNRSIMIYDENGQRQGTHEIRSGALDFFVLGDRSLLICYITETERIVP